MYLCHFLVVFLSNTKYHSALIRRSLAMYKTFYQEAIVNNVKVKLDSDSNITDAGLNLYSPLNLSNSFFTDMFTFTDVLLHFPMK